MPLKRGERFETILVSCYKYSRALGRTTDLPQASRPGGFLSMKERSDRVPLPGIEPSQRGTSDLICVGPIPTEVLCRIGMTSKRCDNHFTVP